MLRWKMEFPNANNRLGCVCGRIQIDQGDYGTELQLIGDCRAPTRLEDSSSPSQLAADAHREGLDRRAWIRILVSGPTRVYGLQNCRLINAP